MAGSPQHEQENMQLATNLGNQEYNGWLTKALGLYAKKARIFARMRLYAYEEIRSILTTLFKYFNT